MSLKDLVANYESCPSTYTHNVVMQKMEELMPKRDPRKADVINIRKWVENINEICEAYEHTRNVGFRLCMRTHIGKREVDVFGDSMEDGCYSPDRATLKRIYWHAKQPSQRRMAGKRLGYSRLRIMLHQLLVSGVIAKRNMRSLDEIIAGWNKHTIGIDYIEENESPDNR